MAVSINTGGTFTVVTRATGADGEVTTGWSAVKLEGAGGGPSATQSVGSTDLFVEGSDAIETTTNKQRVLLTHNNGSSYDFTSGSTGGGTVKIPNGLFWIWGTFLASGTMFTQANGGFQIMLGDGTNRAYWNVAGSDTYLGGFKKWAISIDLATRFTTDDTGTVQIGNITEFGMATDVGGATTRFANFVVDAYDIGTGLTFTGSTVSDSLFLEAFNAQDTAKIGILQNSNGIIFCQGNIEFDGATQTSIGETLVFTDTVLDTNYVYSCNFTGTHVITNSNINKAGGVSYNLDTTGGTVTATGGAYSNFNTITLGSGQTWTGQVFQSGGTSSIAATVSDASFNQCGVATLTGSGTLSGCNFLEATGTAAVQTTSVSNLTNCVFTKGTNTSHAVEMTTAPAATVNWTCTDPDSTYVTGTSGNNVTTGTSGNEHIYINTTSPSSQTVNISVGAGAVVPSVRKGSNFTGQVNVLAGQTTVTVSPLVAGSEVRVYSRDGSGNNDVELDGVESSGTSFNFTLSAGTIVNVVVFNTLYIPVDIYNYTVPSANATLPVSQRLDRNYKT